MSEIAEKIVAKLEQGWCQIHAARDINGHEVEPTSLDACAWCLSGALDALGLGHVYTDLTEFARSHRGIFGAIAFNDAPGRTKEEVIAFVREALADFKEQP